jgi:hypothetical protein
VAPTKAKAKTKSEPEPIDATPDASPEVVPGAPVIDAAPGPPKRSVGPKELPPFEWKVIGESYGAIVTLYKSIEREDADAQLERLERDGYYAKLRIVEAKEVIKQPASARDTIIPPKSFKTPAPQPAAARRTSKKTAPRKAEKVAPPKPRPKTAAQKTARKPAPKKKAAVKKTRKAARRKKK